MAQVLPALNLQYRKSLQRQRILVEALKLKIGKHIESITLSKDQEVGLHLYSVVRPNVRTEVTN